MLQTLPATALALRKRGSVSVMMAGDQSLWRFLISLRSSRAIINVTLNSLE
jgi:hypothetical protein